MNSGGGTVSRFRWRIFSKFFSHLFFSEKSKNFPGTMKDFVTGFRRAALGLSPAFYSWKFGPGTLSRFGFPISDGEFSASS